MTVIRQKIYTTHFHALAKYYTNFMAVMGITCMFGLGICKKISHAVFSVSATTVISTSVDN
jgi:hypothetical protein